MALQTFNNGSLERWIKIITLSNNVFFLNTLINKKINNINSGFSSRFVFYSKIASNVHHLTLT